MVDGFVDEMYMNSKSKGLIDRIYRTVAKCKVSGNCERLPSQVRHLHVPVAVLWRKASSKPWHFPSNSSPEHTSQTF